MSNTIDAQSISRFQKERYLRTLNEDTFRDVVIRPLFYRLGFGDGRDTCGPSEHGKDALFTEKDNLGQLHIVAVQTKVGNLNLASKASTNLINAVAQIRTALSNPIEMLNTKSSCLPIKIYLCASGKINEAAKSYVRSQVSDPRIHFLDIDELIPHIDARIPEIWYGIDAEILPYFRAIKRLVEAPSKVEAGNEGRPDILMGSASDIGFVSLNLYRAGTKSRKIQGRTVLEPTMEEFPITALPAKRYTRSIILADAGMGKSTALLRMAYLIADKGIVSDIKYQVPILVRATEIADDIKTPLQLICDQAAKKIASIQRSVFTVADLTEGRVLVFVDALDEVPTKEERATVIGVLNEFSKSYPKCRIIVTARPYRDIAAIPGYEAFHISPISWRQAEKIVRSLEKGKKLPAEQTKEVLRRLEQVHGIELNPLLVSVFAATTEYSRQDIPANITELFKKFTELMLGRWDEQKGLAQQYQAPLKDFLLRRIAFQMHEKRSTSVPVGTFEKIVTHELKIRGYSADVSQILHELLHRSGLFRVLSGEIEFRHHLLQEFFAGRGIPSIDFIKKSITEDWWKRAIVFYFGENPGDVATLKDVLGQVPRQPSQEVYEAFTTVGLSLQACYLSEVQEKVDLWKSVISGLALTNSGILAAAAESGKYPLSTFIGYYLYGRDAVALANLKDEFVELSKWFNGKPDALESTEEHEAKQFWFIVALIELGCIVQAKELARKYSPKQELYLLALFLGTRMVQHVRSSSAQQRREAEGLSETLEQRIIPLLGKLKAEFKSQLLEVRQGKIEEIVDNHSPDGGDGKL